MFQASEAQHIKHLAQYCKENFKFQNLDMTNYAKNFELN